MLQPTQPTVDFRYKSKARGNLPTRPGVVLLAVDEPSVGRMLMGVLSRIGVTGPIWMGGPGEGLLWMRETEEEVAILLVDCHLPAEAKRALCLEAWSLRPGLTILLAGKAGEWDGPVETESGALHNVAKPYLPTELAWQLRGLLCT